MRITQSMLSQSTLANLNLNLTAVSRLQQQLSSGKAINQPSDSPTGTNSAMQLRGALASNQQYDRNMTDGKTWLDTTDSTLQSMVSQVQRVRDLTVQAMNSGAMSSSNEADMAAEVDQLRSSLLSVANTQLEGRPIFGGATSGKNAYDAGTGAYLGRGGTAAEPAIPNTRRMSSDATVRVDITGAEAFGDQTQGPDLFQTVGAISGDMKTGNTSDLSNQLSALDTAVTRLTNAQADVGARSKRLDDAQTVNASLKLSLTSQLSGVEDADMPSTITALQLQENGYQAALAVSSRSLQQSLVNFLQ